MSLLKHPRSLKPWPQVSHQEFIVNEEKIAKKAKLDSLGRQRHPNQSNGRNRIYYHTISVRLDKESYEQLKKNAKGSLGAKIRDYIEWGLENDK